MRTFACSDLHGRMDLYNQIKAYLEPDDIVYFLGDAGDRGPHSWELIKTIYNDPQFIYLKGNHEDMLVKTMDESIKYYRGPDWQLLAGNGGRTTFYDWSNDPDKDLWIHRLRELPTSHIYVNNKGLRIFLTHAGFTPIYNDNDEIVIPEEQDLIWDRYHFNDPWPVDTDDVIIVHGHTPIPYLCEDLNTQCKELGSFWYAEEHKVCLDSGAFFTGFAGLLDLNTLETKTFFIE